MFQGFKSALVAPALVLAALSFSANAQAAVAQVKPVLEYAEVVEVEEVATAVTPAPVAAPAPARSTAVINTTARPAVSETVAATRATGRSVVLKATAYNSIPNQTDATPHITATGTRTRPGVVALSRDMLRVFPYGTRVTIQDLSGRYNFAGRVFIVEDTMHPRKTGQVDIWMPTYRDAINFGTSTVRVTALR